MHVKRTQLSYEGQPIYVGIDVHKRQWNVSIRTADIHHKTFAQPPNVETLVSYLRRWFPGGTYQCVYEAGFCGFSAAHGFAAHGIECRVIHPPDIPTSERDRLHKRDPVDARRLARELAVGHLKSIYIPEERALEDRALIRMRERFVRKLTRCKTQIRHTLMFFGIELPEQIGEKSWSRAFIKWLEHLELTTPSGTQALQALVRELIHQRGQVADLTRQIRRLAATEPYAEGVRLLCTIPGVGMLTAMTVLTEVIDIRRFRTNDQLASYAGMPPGTHSSGEKEKKTGLHHRRNAALRRALIESAWSAVQYDPVLLAWFTKTCRRRLKTVAIVGVARRLLNRMAYVLRHGRPYQIRYDAAESTEGMNSER